MKCFLPCLVIFFILNSCVSISVQPVFRQKYYWNTHTPLIIPISSPFVIKNSLISFSGLTNITESPIPIETTSSNLILKADDLLQNISEQTGIVELTSLHNRVFLFNVVIDRSKPKISVLAVSPLIRTGGSAVVILKINEPHLQEIFITDASGKRFYPTRFITSDTFITLITWQLWLKSPKFKIFAKDKAGNTAYLKLKIRKKSKKYPVSDLIISKSFFQEKVNELPVKNTINLTNKKMQYNAIINAMRKTKKVNIPKLTSIHPDRLYLNPIAFTPIYNARITSTFGKLRRYVYRGKAMKQSYHLGIDLASVPKADIHTQIGGTVIFSGYNGGYGKTIILSHGMGLYSLYSHCSKLLFENGDLVSPDSIIAYTGSTGFATGDHLHFGIVIQGTYANPLEWMNKTWIQQNILNPIHKAKQKIISETIRSSYHIH